MVKRLKLNRSLFNQKNMVSKSISGTAFDTRLSRPTVSKYLDNSEELERFDGKVLYSIFVNGMGMSLEEMKALKIGDVFEIVEDGSVE